MSTIRLGNRSVGEGEPTFIVAEVSCNHQQHYEQAEALIHAAHEAGADAIKLQTYTPDTITIDSKKKWFYIDTSDNPESWKGKTFYDLYREAYTPWEWHKSLKELANSLGMIFFSTPFDATAVDFLESLHVPCYKVASYECTDIPLLKKIASTGKPIIMSLGFATLDEATYSVEFLRSQNVNELALLHCTTSYGEEGAFSNTHLKTMDDLKRRFHTVIGFSDNMGGIDVPIFAASVGASIIEKHIVLDHAGTALDERFSLDPSEFRAMVQAIRAKKCPGTKAWQQEVLGKVCYGCKTPSEEGNKRYRRSLFVVQDVKKGELFTEKNVRCIRPSFGLEPRYYLEVLGKKASRDVERGDPLSWEMLDRS